MLARVLSGPAWSAASLFLTQVYLLFDSLAIGPRQAPRGRDLTMMAARIVCTSVAGMLPVYWVGCELGGPATKADFWPLQDRGRVE